VIQKILEKISPTRFFSGTYSPICSFSIRAAIIAPPQRCSATLARPAFPPPPRSVPGHFALWSKNKVTNDDEFSRNHPGIDGKLSGRWLQYR
jgi:hypothetical protein